MSTLPLESLQRIDKVCAQFERDWKPHETIRIEDYLDALPDADREQGTEELLRLEIELRRNRAELPRADEYALRFAKDIVERAFTTSDVPPHTFEALRSKGYEILETIGRGGMGVVYKARHVALDRLVALKLIVEGVHAQRKDLDRFFGEARLVARLQHPNIIQIYEVGEADGLAFLALELARDGNLEARLASTPQDPRHAAEIIEALANATRHAHAQGIIHRDLKPANVLLAPMPKIADFGLAKQVDDAAARTRTGEILGSASYMAPEQATGNIDAIGPATDIYALGAILYEMLTGRPPFKAATVVATLDQVVSQEPVAPRRLQRSIPNDLETITLKCLEKDSRRRYPTAADLAEDLGRFLRGEPIVARRTAIWERGSKWAKRRPLVAALAAATLLTATLGLLGIVWQWRDAVAARAYARRQLYRSSIAAAASALELHNHIGVARSLESAPPEFRGWEWRHFRSQLDNSAARLRGHTDGVSLVTYSPDGSRILSGSVDGTFRLWDASSHRLIAVLRHTRAVFAGSFTLDGDRIATIAGNEVRLWDATSGTLIAALPHPGDIAAHAFSRDGSLLATGEMTGDHVYLWDVATRRLLATMSNPYGTDRLAFHPDGTRLISTERVWDTTGREILAFARGKNDRLACLSFSPDGTRMATGIRFPANKVAIWDLRSGKQIAVGEGHQNEINAVAFSPDGSRIATASYDQTARLWDAKTLQPIAVLRGHSGWVRSIAFNPAGTRVLSASEDGTLRLWDASNGDLVAVLRGHAGGVNAGVFSPDGSQITSASADGTVAIWDVRLLERSGVLRGHTSYVYGIAVHPDGDRIASVAWDGTLRVWSAEWGKSLLVLDCGGEHLLDVAFSPDGKLVAAGSRSNNMRVWETATGKLLYMVKAPRGLTSVAFSPDGKTIAATLGTVYAEFKPDDNVVWLLDSRSGALRRVLRGHTNNANVVRFSPDGTRIVTGGYDHTLRIWDSATGAPLRSIPNTAVQAAAFNREGTLIATGTEDGKIELRNGSGDHVATMLPGSAVYSVAFSPDGKRLAAGCADNTIRLWDVDTQEETAQLRGHGAYVHAVGFSPDGTRLVSGSGDGTVRVWDTVRR